MFNESQYPHDVEFRKLLQRDTEIDLTVAALELARDFYPQLEFAPVQEWIAARGHEVLAPVARATSDREVLKALVHCLGEVHGLHGQPESYESADSSFLHKVIERKTGIPISLSVLYLGVAQAAGVSLAGVSSPGHFLTRYEGESGPLFIDAFPAGEILTLPQALTRIEEMTGLAPEVALSTLEPALPRTIILRMLNNLKGLFTKQENWTNACLVQHRLTALQPGSYTERRDLAVLTLHARQAGRAVDLLENCLRSCPAEERTWLQQKLAEARKQLALSN